jgi:hypothetical protein
MDQRNERINKSVHLSHPAALELDQGTYGWERGRRGRFGAGSSGWDPCAFVPWRLGVEILLLGEGVPGTDFARIHGERPLIRALPSPQPSPTRQRGTRSGDVRVGEGEERTIWNGFLGLGSLCRVGWVISAYSPAKSVVGEVGIFASP